MHTDPRSAARPLTTLDVAYRSTDVLLSRLLLAHLAAALALAPLHGTWTAALLVGGGTSALAMALARGRAGAVVTRLVMGAALMVYSSLFIHQTHGLIEAHFHVFVALAFLISYRDWRVPVTAAGVIAVQHVLFFGLQQAGRGVWLVNHGHGYWIVLVHAGLVVFEVAVLVHLSLQMRRSADEAQGAFDAATRLAAGDFAVTLAGGGAAASVAQVAETLRSVEAAAGALAERVRTGAVPRGTDATAGATLPGAFGSIMARLAEAADASDALHDTTRAEAARGAAFMEELRGIAAGLRAGDLTVRVAGRHDGTYGAVAAALSESLAQLSAAMRDVAASSEAIGHATGRVARGSGELAAAAVDQAAGLDTTAASLHELASMAAQSSEGAEHARLVAHEARRSTESGVAEMTRLAEAVAAMRASADATAKIVKAIDEIAFQTNLLALNASVEAARAGDAGRGFAVVAEEVRALALRSAEAAGRTAALIEDGVRHTDTGVALTEAAAARLREIDGRVSEVSDVVATIAAASARQREGVRDIDVAVGAMRDVTRRTVALAEESAGAAAALSEEATRLRETVDAFTLDGGARGEPGATPSAPRPGARVATAAPAASFKPERRRSVWLPN